MANGNGQLFRNKTTLVTFVTIMLVLLIANSVMVAPYLLTVVMGGIMALIFHPAHNWLISKNFGRNISALIICFAFCVLVVVPVGLFTVATVDQGVEFAKHVSENKTLTFDTVRNWLVRWKPLRVIIGDSSQIDQQIREGLQKGGTLVSQTLLGIFSSLPELALQMVLFVLSCFFLLVDGRVFYVWLRDRLPLDADVRQKLFNSFRNTAVSSIVATIAAALTQGFCMFITFIALGIPGSFLGAGLTFIFAWIPFLGSMPVAFAAAIYLYAQSEIVKLVILVVAAILIGLSDNVTRAFVLRGRDEMHPLVSLVAIFGGIALFGLFGVFIGPILGALLLSVLQIWPDVGHRFGLFEVPIVTSDSGIKPQKPVEFLPKQAF